MASRRSSDTVGRMWLVSGSGRHPQKGAQGRRQRGGLIDLGRGVERGAAKLRWERRGSVQVATPIREQAHQMRRGVAVAPVLEHPRQELVGRLLGRELGLVILGRRKQQPRLQLEQRGDQDEELGGGVEVELAGALEVLEVGDHDLAQRHLGEAHLLAEHHRHQQVERPGEDLEVEVELGCPHRRRA